MAFPRNEIKCTKRKPPKFPRPTYTSIYAHNKWVMFLMKFSFVYCYTRSNAIQMTNEIQLKLESNGKGAFVIEESGEQIADMAFAIANNNLTVFHTHVSEKLQGQGVAAKLLEHMVQ